MNQQQITRRHYLQAMGIPLWEPVTENKSAAYQIEDDVQVAEVCEPESLEYVVGKVDNMDWQQLMISVQSCTHCDLHKTRTRTVFGTGDHNAQWLFVGEAPGADEDRQGEPFVGKAGGLLNAMLLALKLRREQVYIANVLKCRPPGNRDPQPKEVSCCEPYLARQIALIKPKVIVALGRHAAHNLLRTDKSLARLRGQSFSYHDIPLLVTYHPAYLLRNPVDKQKVWEDLCRARAIVEGI